MQLDELFIIWRGNTIVIILRLETLKYLNLGQLIILVLLYASSSCSSSLSWEPHSGNSSQMRIKLQGQHSILLGLIGKSWLRGWNLTGVLREHHPHGLKPKWELWDVTTYRGSVVELLYTSSQTCRQATPNQKLRANSKFTNIELLWEEKFKEKGRDELSTFPVYQADVITHWCAQKGQSVG